MKITFDSSLKIAGVSVMPWNRLGLENWLPAFKIASLFDWGGDVWDLPQNYSLSRTDVPAKLVKFNTYQLLRAPEFQRILQSELRGYDLLTYKPVEVPVELRGRKFLMTNSQIAGPYENKVFFRERFADRLTIPPYKIVRVDELVPSAESFEALKQGWPKLVLQDERLSGSKGTHIIDSLDALAAAADRLKASTAGKRVVASQFIEGGRERSIQACVTAQAVFTGPLQRQFVREPALCNPGSPSDKFCGAAILAADQGTAQHQAAAAVTQTIGSDMQAAGYRGIFGVDFLESANGQLYVLEVNPRLTGVTPLLNALFQEGQIPFYLLHVLELGGYAYTITDDSQSFEAEGSLLVLHSKLDYEAMVRQRPASGSYRINGRQLEHLSGNVRLQQLPEQAFVLQSFTAPGMRVRPGGRLAALYFRGAVIDISTDKLYNHVLQAIEAVESSLEMESPNGQTPDSHRPE